MTTDELLRRLECRGLAVELGPDGGPRLRGAREVVTPALRSVLRWHREEIIRRLAVVVAPATPDGRVVECRWASGYVGRHWFPESGWPVGARQWRYAGEVEWQQIPEPELPRTGWPSPADYARLKSSDSGLAL